MRHIYENTIRIFTEGDDGDEELELHPPGHWVTCPRCEGWGTHTNPAIDGNGITPDEMAELGPDFREDYLSGVYDVVCSECGGKRLTWEIDWDRWYEISPEHARLYQKWLDDEAEYQAICAAERRAGA